MNPLTSHTKPDNTIFTAENFLKLITLFFAIFCATQPMQGALNLGGNLYLIGVALYIIWHACLIRREGDIHFTLFKMAAAIGACIFLIYQVHLNEAGLALLRSVLFTLIAFVAAYFALNISVFSQWVYRFAKSK